MAQSTTTGLYSGYTAELVSEVTDAAKWYVLTADEAKAKLASATAESPMSATFLIGDADFSRNHTTTAWTTQTGIGSINNTSGKASYSSNYCTESYHQTFTLSQTISVPNGHYKLSAQGFYRQDGSDNDNLPYFFLNDTKVMFPVKTGSENSMADAGESFKTAGTYSVTTDMVTVTDGTITIGAKNESNASLWCIWDNFDLTYYGPITDFTSYVDILAEQVKAGNDIKDKTMNSAVKTALGNAITEYSSKTTSSSYSTEADWSAAITAMKTAVENANTSISNYATAKTYLDAASSLDEAGKTNYAADATVSALQTAYDNGSLEAVTTEQETALVTAIQTAAKAQTTAGADMTLAIVNPSFETGNYNGWTTTKSKDTGAKPTSNNTYKMEGAVGNYLFNNWSVGYDISQTITGLPLGKYTVSAVMGTDKNQTLVLKLNNNEATVASSSTGATVGVSNSCDVLVTDGTLTISAGTSNQHWYKVDNFKLTFVEALTATECHTQITSLLSTAETLSTSKMNKDVATALTTAITNGKSTTAEESLDKLTSALNALKTAIANAQTSVDAYAAAKTELDRRKTVVESENNVYTADALNTYYTEPLAKYNEATLTNSEANALVENWGLRTAVQTTAFLGSAFGVSDYNGVPYINTWSTEGNSDGSNFKTPFYEYWVANAEALADKTLTATLTGLTAGEEYAVSAWVRVRLQNDKEAPATGITLQANDGDAVAITGTQVGDSRLYLDNYTVYGTVGEDGKLEIKFNVASTNVSWLAFQNLHYAKVESVTLDETKENGLEPLAAVAGKPAEVTFTRNFTKDLNSTICLPYDVTPDASAGTFYTFAGVTEENGEYVVTMSENTATTLTANTPYLFKPAGGEVTFTGKIAKVADTYTPTDVTEGDWTFAGSYNKVQWNAESAWEDYTAVYCYSMSANATGISDGDFVKVKKPSTGFVSTPFRCMMKYKAAANEGEGAKAREMNTIPSSMKVVLINADGTSTAIDAIDVETEFADGAWYTIDGRKLQGKPAVKGIYINGGQKVLIK